MRIMILLIAAATMIGAPAALAQTTGTPNSGAGVHGMPGNKSGPAMKPQTPAGEQSTSGNKNASKVPGLPGNKSGPAQKPAK